MVVKSADFKHTYKQNLGEGRGGDFISRKYIFFKIKGNICTYLEFKIGGTERLKYNYKGSRYYIW